LYKTFVKKLMQNCCWRCCLWTGLSPCTLELQETLDMVYKAGTVIESYSYDLVVL